MLVADETALSTAISTAFPTATKVLVIAPHPDDEVFGCGGTLLLLKNNGSLITTIIVTDGALGGENKGNALIKRRANESCAAASSMGLDAPLFWGIPDRSIRYHEPLIVRLMEAITAHEADLVLLPSPTDWHPDHQTLAFAGAEAIRRLGGQRYGAFYEVTDSLPCPNLIHDISAVATQKQQAMHCFASQLQEQPYDTRIVAINHFRALHLGAQVQSAEAFTLFTAADLAKGLPSVVDGPLATRRDRGFAGSGTDIPLVSIIIRSIDRPTLGDALDSIILQSYPNIETILVNAKGGEHQTTAQWATHFPIQTINSDGLTRSQAANRGLVAAQGEYLLFLDDDDWIEADHIQKLVVALQQHPDYQVAYTGVRCVDGQKNPLDNTFDAPFDPVQLIAGNFIPIHAVLFARDLLKHGCRVDETLDLYEDWDFWLQLSQYGHFLKVDGLSAVYRITQQTGFGVNTDPSIAEPAALVIYQRWLNRLLDRRQIAELMQTVRYSPLKDKKISELQHLLTQRDALIAGHTATIRKMNQSHSWQITQPLRTSAQWLRGLLGRKQ